VAELMTLAVIGLDTYAMRAAFLVTARHGPPTPMARLLPFVGPTVLAAITLPAFVAPHGSVSIAATVPALLAAIVAWMAWRYTKQFLGPSGTLRVGKIGLVARRRRGFLAQVRPSNSLTLGAALRGCAV
jgi:branched-subunit amino acid transport protein